MRLDHFVLHNNHLTTTTTNGGSMSNPLETPSVTSSRGFQSSHSTWVETMRNDVYRGTFRVHGRIRDTGVNYIVEGWEVVRGSDRTRWIQVPCKNLPSAQILLISIMDKESFNAERTRQAWDRMESEGMGYDDILKTLNF